MKKLEKIFYSKKENKKLKELEENKRAYSYYTIFRNVGLTAITLGFLFLVPPIYNICNTNKSTFEESLKKDNKIEQLYNPNPAAYGLYHIFSLAMFAGGAIPLGMGLDGRKYYKNKLDRHNLP